MQKYLILRSRRDLTQIDGPELAVEESMDRVGLLLEDAFVHRQSLHFVSQRGDAGDGPFQGEQLLGFGPQLLFGVVAEQPQQN